MKHKGQITNKGQITILIIIGIVIILSIALFMAFKQRVWVFKPKEVLPPEISAIKLAIEECIDAKGRDAANIIGTTGGFIRIPSDVLADPSSYLETSPFEGMVTPYWHHVGELRIPSQEYIEAEIEDYIESELAACLGGFALWADVYKITELDIPSADVSLGEEAILIKVDYPIEIADLLGNKITMLKHFEVAVPYRLKLVYELAKEIMHSENEHMKIEDIAMDLIALADEREVPYTDIVFGQCKAIRWQIADIKSRIKELLRTNLPMLRIKGTKYAPIPDEQEYVKSHFVWDTLKFDYPDLMASFAYDERWPLKLYIKPNKGTYLESGNLKGSSKWLDWFCIQSWKFNYDIEFPVLVRIVDDKSGYVFNFAFKAMVRNNEGDRKTIRTRVFELPTRPRNEEFCARRNRKLYILSFANVSTDDEEQHYEIAGVNITLVCLRYSCALGSTTWSDGGAVAVLEKMVPACPNALIRAEAEGYKSVELFTSTEREKEIAVYLRPVKRIKSYEVVKHPFEAPGMELELRDGETVQIAINRPDHSVYVEWNKQLYENGTLEPIELLAGTDFKYNLSILLVEGDTMKGGYVAEWQPEWIELKDADHIVFHVIAKDVEDADFLLALEGNSTMVPKPELVKKW